MRPAIVVTGISGNLGRTLAKLLHKSERIIGIDRRPFVGRPKDVEMYQLDLRKKKAEDVFRKNEIRAVIHMGIMHDPRMSEEEHHSFNVVGTTRLLEYCAKYGVKKVVFLSSANVYGPSPDNSNFLTEDAPLMASSRFSGVRDLIEVDMLAHGFFWRHPDINTVILRPVHIVGPTIRNAPSNYLRLRHPWTLAGFDPMVQLIHMEDVARAMVEALRPEPKGVYNVVGPGEVPLSSVLRELGHVSIPVPHPIARPVLSMLFKYRLANFPPPELDHIQFLCNVDGSRWRKELGWKPHHSMRDTIRSVIGE
ncbi:SDR family oxidoreductase [Stigmatella aurantiaca]|uniref:NAD dependent epimerase/dehydratase family n=1 Tax=Stigmatella aurantiaca (strain DW4/3-1) TaxID=378806 RepID=Q08SV5_STIAD|nr:SDR family oxidoreductase [Stigmatella aurantiaca]ADO70512.1 NAD dependent epimerase/dehydratase family protein [Stigmatella aurantiaca DW4/3-1]EAU63553.1 NAD dependent epimerase/dehydratase family [Stigmatella aurantiaca DW4/3-1]